MTLQIVASLIDAARGVIYDHHMFIVQATDGVTNFKYKLLCLTTKEIFLQREEGTSF